MIVKLYCDKCNKEVASKDRFLSFNLSQDNNSDGYEQRYGYETKDIKHIHDICLDCAREIVSFITQRDKWTRV